MHPFSPQRLLTHIFERKSVARHVKRNGKRLLKAAERIEKDLEKATIEGLVQLEDRRYREFHAMQQSFTSLQYSLQLQKHYIIDDPVDMATVLAELPLPPWVGIIDIGTPLEALGAFYEKQGRAECIGHFLSFYSYSNESTEASRLVIPLHLQSLSFPLSPASPSTPR